MLNNVEKQVHSKLTCNIHLNNFIAKELKQNHNIIIFVCNFNNLFFIYNNNQPLMMVQYPIQVIKVHFLIEIYLLIIYIVFVFASEIIIFVKLNFQFKYSGKGNFDKAPSYCLIS